jgi:hypothetical protein
MMIARKPNGLRVLRLNDFAPIRDYRRNRAKTILFFVILQRSNLSNAAVARRSTYTIFPRSGGCIIWRDSCLRAREGG